MGWLLFVIIGGIILFIVYFQIKAIQFTLTATNLYKRIIAREDIIIRLLVDIRNNTKLVESETLSIGNGSAPIGNVICPNCNVPCVYNEANQTGFCPQCEQMIKIQSD